MCECSGKSGRTIRAGRSGTSGLIASIPDGKKSTAIAKKLLQDFPREGFNEHELDAMEEGYIDNYFEYYLPLKLKLLEMRRNAKSDNEKVYSNYLRVLTYTLFENSWFVYLMTDDHEFTFTNIGLKFTNPYHNHLPSFSSALLHIGSCYDQFFVFINLFYEGSFTNPSDLNGKLKVNFRGPDKNKYPLVLEKISTDPGYIQKGNEILNSNKFRNYFAHQVRLLWWHRNDTTLFYFPRDLYDKIMSQGNDGRQEVFNMLIDTEQYEKNIQTYDVQNMISSKEIMFNYHDEMTRYFNLTFFNIFNKL